MRHSGKTLRRKEAGAERDGEQVEARVVSG